MSEQRQAVYLNPKQRAFVSSKVKTKAFIGGRGAGKTTTLGAQNAIRVSQLPRAKGAWVGPTIGHLKTKVVPSALEMLKRMGFIEARTSSSYGHFVTFKKPPEHWHTPFQEPKDYENIITFCNGYTIELASWYMIDGNRGANYDFMDIDEAGWLEKSMYDAVLLPAVRGNERRFRDNPYHQQVCFYTSKPRLALGKWINDYEKMAELYPEEYCFVTCTSWDNIAVLGERTLKKWEREMNPIEYTLEVMCQDIDKLPNCYYDEYEAEKHSYLLSKANIHKDILPELPLMVSFDFNAGFISCIIAQMHESDNELRIVKELFVKEAKIIDHLLDKFIDEFRFHEKKEIRIYGDRGGNNKQVNSKETHFQLISRYLQQHGGWDAYIDALSYYPEHQNKHDIINKALSETYPACPKIRVSKRGCPFLATTIPNTPVDLDYKKDKSSEKDENIPPEMATHLSDAFDYLVFPIVEPYIENGRSLRGVGIEFI